MSSAICSMRCAIPYPCIFPRDSALSTSMSKVPCGRSGLFSTCLFLPRGSLVASILVASMEEFYGLRGGRSTVSTLAAVIRDTLSVLVFLQPPEDQYGAHPGVAQRERRVRAHVSRVVGAVGD